MPKAIGWTLWLVALAFNGFFVFLWVVFGLAGAGTTASAAAQGLIWGTALGVGLSLLCSMRFAVQERFAQAALTTLLFLPSAIALSIALGKFASVLAN